MKKILLSIGMMGAIATPIVAAVACGSTTTSPKVADNDNTKTPPKTNEKTQAEINAENLKALNEAKTYLESIDLDNLSKIKEKPSMVSVSGVDGKEVLKKYLQLSDTDLENFNDINVAVAVSNPGDVYGTLEMTITLTKGEQEVQSATVNLSLTNFLNNDTYNTYLDEKFFDDMHEVYKKDNTLSYSAMDPINTSWQHSANWWQSSHHQLNGFNYQDADQSLKNTINGRDLNANKKAIFKEVLNKIVGVKTIPSKLISDDVEIITLKYFGIALVGNSGNKTGFTKYELYGWPNGYVALKLKIKKGTITKDVALFIIGWVPFQQHNPDV